MKESATDPSILIMIVMLALITGLTFIKLVERIRDKEK